MVLFPCAALFRSREGWNCPISLVSRHFGAEISTPKCQPGKRVFGPIPSHGTGSAQTPVCQVDTLASRFRRRNVVKRAKSDSSTPPEIGRAPRREKEPFFVTCGAVVYSVINIKIGE